MYTSQVREASAEDTALGSVGDGEGDVPEVLSRCQVALWEASSAVNQEITPYNEQLRELVRQRYIKTNGEVSGMVDGGSGTKIRVNVQVHKHGLLLPLNSSQHRLPV